MTPLEFEEFLTKQQRKVMDKMKSWKTTATGVCAIIAAIVGVVTNIVNNHPIDWTTTIAAVTSGIGLITARDNNVSSESAGAK